jgi:hypothetical protein
MRRAAGASPDANGHATISASARQRKRTPADILGVRNASRRRWRCPKPSWSIHANFSFRLLVCSAARWKADHAGPGIHHGKTSIHHSQKHNHLSKWEMQLLRSPATICVVGLLEIRAPFFYRMTLPPQFFMPQRFCISPLSFSDFYRIHAY